MTYTKSRLPYDESRLSMREKLLRRANFVANKCYLFVFHSWDGGQKILRNMFYLVPAKAWLLVCMAHP